MKMQADNINNRHFDVTLELADNEKGRGFNLIEFSFGVSGIITEMITQNCENQEQAKKASEVILQLVNTNVNKHVKNFSKIKELELTKQLYGLMEKMYTEWLDETACLTEEELTDIFADSREFILKPAPCSSGVDIFLSNGRHDEYIINIPKDIIENDMETMEHLCMAAYAIAQEAGDRIFGRDSNPLRSGDSVKDLAKAVRKLV